MDWLIFTISVGSALFIGGLLTAVVGVLLTRRQRRGQARVDILHSFREQIESAERRGDVESANRLRRDNEVQLEAWRAQQGVVGLAPRTVSMEPGRAPTLSADDVERLKVLLQQSEGLNPALLSAEDHWLRGNAYYHEGQYREAVRGYDRALQLRPGFSEAYNGRGVAYLYLKMYQQALADFAELLRLKPDFASAYSNLACLWSLQEDMEACLTNLERAVRWTRSIRGKGGQTTIWRGPGRTRE